MRHQLLHLSFLEPVVSQSVSITHCPETSPKSRRKPPSILPRLHLMVGDKLWVGPSKQPLGLQHISALVIP
ncbi:hypothetical protein LY78DRAFT_652093 [Colletotrichum sublineola]|nr:hypothetical protein LY78DRAFT_652093 [Colletotrichum sublineola]